MNEALREAQAVDPEWAKKEGRRRAILGLLTVGVLVALAVGVPALVIGFHNGTEITQIQHSACQVEPSGEECQKAKAESSEAATLRTTCIPFFKAGYPCPKPGSTAAERQARRQSLRADPAQATPPTTGGDATSAPTGSSQPGRHDGGSGGGTDQPSRSHAPSVPHQSPPSVPGEHGGGEDVPGPAPTAPPTATSSQSSSSSTTEHATESTVVETAPEAPVREAVGGVVEEVGSTVTGTVEGVTGTTCTLAKVLCSE
jgi:hypothetical protein